MTALLQRLKQKAVAGAAAGNVTVTGIAAVDRIISVQAIDITLTEGAPNTRAWTVADLTAEFSVTAANTINNTSGTSSAGKLLLVTWEANGPVASGRTAY